MTYRPPTNLGPFTFPAPYGTTGIRLTNPTNVPAGCHPRLYPYWSTVNNHRGADHLYVVVGRVNDRPLLLRVHKTTGTVETQARPLPEGTAEGWYFSDTLPHALYLLDGPRLLRLDVTTGHADVVFTLDAGYGHHLWQAHSSANDRVHSATVKDGANQNLGCVVSSNGQQHFFPAHGDLDECQIDKSGRFLIIQENNDNRIIDLETGQVRIITNAAGAIAHLDVGDGFMVGEDDQHEPSALVKWDLKNPHAPRQLLHSTVWGPGMGHVAVRGNAALLSSNATDELIRVPLDGSPPQAMAPGMMAGDGYDNQLRATFDPPGEYGCWVSNVDVLGGRYDTFLVRVSTASTPPIIVRPPDPKPGGPTVPGSQPYPSETEGGWWEQFEREVAAVYAEKGQPFPDSPAAFRWHGRTAYDIGAGMDREQSKAKHLRELRQALGLDGGTNQNP